MKPRRNRAWLTLLALGWFATGAGDGHGSRADEAKSSRPSSTTWTYQVVDEAGTVVPNAKWTAESWKDSLTGTSDAMGLCRITRLHHGTIVVSDEQGRLGFATSWRKRLPKTERIVMKPPRSVTVRVVDEDGQGVAEADVNVISNAGPFALKQTESDGTVSFKIPVDASVEWIAAKKTNVGFDYFENYESFPTQEFPELPAEVRLTLNGARKIKARVVDTAGQPIPGVMIYPWTIHKPGKLSYINSLTRLFNETSDANGRVSFDGMPGEFLHGITFLSMRDGFDSPDQTSLRSDATDRSLVLKMTRNARLSGRIVGGDGQPVPGLTLHVEGRGATNMYFREEIAPDDSGRYEISVAAGQAYLLAIEHADFAAPAQVTPILKEREERTNLDFTLSPGTLIRGQVTIGKTPRPAKGQTVTLIQQAGNVPEARPFFGSTSIDLVRWTETDDEGRYSLRVGPGEFRLQLPHQPFEQRELLSIKAERELVRDYHADYAERGSLSGRATLPDGLPAERATVYGAGVPSSRGAGFRCRTDRDGQYKTERWVETTLLMVTSSDGRFAGFATVTRDDESINVSLTPAAKLVGRVLDSSKKPAARRRITATVARAIHLEALTDEDGRYEIPLAVGSVYELHTWPDNKLVSIGRGNTPEAKTYEIPDFVLGQP